MVSKSKKLTTYGKELLLDLSECDIKKFKKASFKKFFVEVCDLIDMQREQLNFCNILDEKEKPNVIGITAIQFIMTSNITIHAYTSTGKAYVNIFSCKEFEEKDAIEFTKNWFGGKVLQSHVFARK